VPGHTLCRVNARPETVPGDAEVALERRRARYLVLLTVFGLIGEAVGAHFLLLSGYCPGGKSCLVSGSVGGGLVSLGLLSVIIVGVLGELLLASALAFLGVGAGGLTASAQGAGWVGAVVGGEFFAMGLILLGFRRWQDARHRRVERDEAALWASGRPGRAVVIDVDDAGQRAGRRRIVTLVLRIDPGDGGQRYDAQVEHWAEPGEHPAPGDLHPVRVDPEDRTRIVLGRKETPEGTPEETA
jgi:hypothetical protein